MDRGRGGKPGMPKDSGTTYVLARPSGREAAFSTSPFSLPSLPREAAPVSILDPPFCDRAGYTVLGQLITQVGLWEKAWYQVCHR